MKILLGLLVSAQAFACPDLRGTFVCETGETFEISQVENEKLTTYTVGGEKYLADGVKKTITRGWYKFTKKTSCNDGSLIISEEQISDDFYTRDDNKFSLDFDQNLKLVYTSTEIDMGEESIFEQVFSCSRR